jgi:hypothetical protein
MGYRLDDQGLIPGKGKRFFSTPQNTQQLWGPPCLLSSISSILSNLLTSIITFYLKFAGSMSFLDARITDDGDFIHIK